MPGLSGPIDDAFMEPFLFVRPTGKPLNEKVAAWSDAELRHATKMWRDLFRGDRSRTERGLGLGLSLVAAVARLHGAQIETLDNAPGFTVRLWFPASARPGFETAGAQ